MFGRRTALLVAALVLSARPAGADPLPPNDCQSQSVNQPCTTAGSDFSQAGTCMKTTCSSLDYDCDAGGVGPCGTTVAPCILCVAPDAGASDAGTAPMVSSTSGGGGGCSVAAGGNGSGVPAFGALGLVSALAMAARRRKAS